MKIETRLVLYPDVYRVDLVPFWSVEELSSVNYTRICRFLVVGARKKPPSGKTELSIAWKTGGFHEERVQDRLEVHAHATQMQLILAGIWACLNMLSFGTWMKLCCMFGYVGKFNYIVYQICSNMGPIFGKNHKWRAFEPQHVSIIYKFQSVPSEKWTNVPLKGAIYCRTTFNIPFTSCFVDFPRHTLTIFAHSDVHRFSVMVWKLQLELQNICTLKRSPRTGK